MGWIGLWESTIHYVLGDVVSWNGSLYEANGASFNDEPPGSTWTAFGQANTGSIAFGQINAGSELILALDQASMALNTAATLGWDALIQTQSTSTSGIGLADAGTGGVQVSSVTQVNIASAAGIVRVTNGATLIQGDTVSIASGTEQLGFFGATPTARPAAPANITDVIAALKALGLVAT